MRHRWMLAAACVAIPLAHPAAAQDVVVGPYSDALPQQWAWFGNTAAGWSAVGQTFTVPAEAPFLTAFSVVLGSSSAPRPLPPTPFRFYVAEWDQAAFRATGGVLFRSALREGIRFVDGSIVRVPHTFHTGLLELTPGAVYLAFLGAPEDVPAQPVEAGTGVRLVDRFPHYQDLYAGGTFVSGRGAYGPTALADSRWSPDYHDGPIWDVRFQAEFTATPEPASMALLGTGLAGLLGAARRRRQKETAQD